MLAALLFQIKPFGRTYNPSVLMTKEEEHFIQQAAWNAVMDERMKPLLPSYATPPVRLTTLSLDKSISSLEQYLNLPMDVTYAFSNSTQENHSKNAIFFSLTPSVAGVDYYGNITATKTGSARIGVWREDKRDTLALSVVPSTAVLDSIAFSPRVFPGYLEQGHQFTVLGHFHKNTQVFSIPINAAVEWICRQPEAFTIRDGILERTGGEGGNMTLVAKKDAFLDSVQFQMGRKLSVVKRINFQGTDSVYHPFWATYDRGRVYDSTRGYGWNKVPYSGNLSTCANCMDFNNELFLTATSVTPGAYAKNEEGIYTINIPDGDYILKTCIGNLAKNALSYVRIDNPYITDTLHKFIPTALNQKSYSIDTLPIHTGKGIELYIRGAIYYLVLISKEGVDIDSVAYDTKTALYGGGSTGNDFNYNPQSSGSLPLITAQPNPFNPSVNISINAKETVRSLSIYDASGRMIADLLPLLHSGKVNWQYNGPSGMYFIKVQASGKDFTKRIILLR